MGAFLAKKDHLLTLTRMKTSVSRPIAFFMQKNKAPLKESHLAEIKIDKRAGGHYSLCLSQKERFFINL